MAGVANVPFTAFSDAVGRFWRPAVLGVAAVLRGCPSRPVGGRVGCRAGAPRGAGCREGAPRGTANVARVPLAAPPASPTALNDAFSALGAANDAFSASPAAARDWPTASLGAVNGTFTAPTRLTDQPAA